MEAALIIGLAIAIYGLWEQGSRNKKLREELKEQDEEDQ